MTCDFCGIFERVDGLLVCGSCYQTRLDAVADEMTDPDTDPDDLFTCGVCGTLSDVILAPTTGTKTLCETCYDAQS